MRTYKKLHVTGIILACFAGGLVVNQCSSTPEHVITYKGRNIDLKPYFEGYPYSDYRAFYDAGKLLYFQSGDRTQLMSIDLQDDSLDLRNGAPITSVDFSKRNCWDMRYLQQRKMFYYTGDEHNDEVINVFSLDPESGNITKLTDVPYVYGYGLSPDGSHLAFIARFGEPGSFHSELRILDLASGETQTLLQDTPEMAFTWGRVLWTPDGFGVIISANVNKDRKYNNFLFIPLDNPEQARLLTDPETERDMRKLKDWLSEESFVYVSNEDGYNNLYRRSITEKKPTQITHFSEDISDAWPVKIDGKTWYAVIIQRAYENKLSLVNPLTRAIQHSQVVDANVSLLDYTENRALVTKTSAALPVRIEELRATIDGFSFEPKIHIPEEHRSQIVHANVQKVEYPTFDTDPETGEMRRLHAFLYMPKNPRSESSEQKALIKSFYGGENEFNKEVQILCEAGFMVMSPAVRGSDGFGKEFAALNDGDLGGNEIIDVIYAGKYLQERFGFDQDDIGVFGASHGGYATMRLLTFPGKVNGITADFDWGFGISFKGFSDIITFYETSNIPDWVTLEAGDPVTERDKLLDRSPLTHAEKLDAPLLLIHGTNDSRVPVKESRQMVNKLKQLDKPVTYFEFSGQGHGIKGLQNKLKYYRQWFDFLELVNEYEYSR